MSIMQNNLFKLTWNYIHCNQEYHLLQNFLQCDLSSYDKIIHFKVKKILDNMNRENMRLTVVKMTFLYQKYKYNISNVVIQELKEKYYRNN